MEEKLVKRLLTTIKCSACGENYDESSIEILGHSDELWFLRMVCSHCLAQALVAAIIKEESRQVAVTDLTGEELERFAALNAIDEEEVRDMHDFLERFEGDFGRLFGEGER